MRMKNVADITISLLLMTAFCFTSFSFVFFERNFDNHAIQTQRDHPDTRMVLSSGNLTNHSPIRIIGDVQLAAFFAGNSTNGSASNPFTLEGFAIDASSAVHGLEIINTTLTIHIKNNAFALASNPVYSSKLPSGIKLYNASNVRITNNTFERNYLGIAIGASSNITILNNSIHNNMFIGIGLNFSSHIVIKNNSFVNCGLHILGSLGDCLSVDIDDSNRINGNGRLFYLVNLNGTIIPAIPDGSQVILVNCTKVTLQDLTTSASSIGIMLLYSDNNNIQNNVISAENYHGIVCAASHNNIIKNNSISGSYYALGILLSDGSRIEGNRISDAIFDGLVIHSCNDTIITSNVLASNTEYGIKVVNSSRCLIRGNLVSKSEVGIGVAWDDYNITISENIVFSCMQYGIVIDFSSLVTISGNTIDSCDVALRISQMLGSAIVYLNNFINSTTSHVDMLMLSQACYNNTLWGNYWDDYVAEYPNATVTVAGTWTTPYFMGDSIVNVTDYHALVSPNHLPRASFSIDRDSFVIGESITFTFTGERGDESATVEWFFGDGVSYISNELSVWYVYNSPGEYTVVLIVTDKHGEQDIAFLLIRVNRSPVLDFLPLIFALILAAVAVVVVIQHRKKGNASKRI
jgi:parallel beta-helix repeat protein